MCVCQFAAMRSIRLSSNIRYANFIKPFTLYPNNYVCLFTCNMARFSSSKVVARSLILTREPRSFSCSVPEENEEEEGGERGRGRRGRRGEGEKGEEEEEEISD